MSGFFYTGGFFGIANETQKTPANLFEEKGKEYCAKKWEDILKEYPDVKPANLEVYCMTSGYIYNLLVRGFGFDAENTNLYITDAIDGTTLNWALGALIAEASLLPK